MSKYYVYYKVNSDLMHDKNLTRNECFDPDYYRRVKEIEVFGENQLEDIFKEMQGDNWSPNGEARFNIVSLGLSHTSMSTGDLIYDTETGIFWQCMMSGWESVRILK